MKYRVTVDDRDNNGKTPLHHAASINSIEAVKVLVNYGAFIIDKNNDGKVPFQQAISENNIKTLNLLLEHPPY